MKSAQETCSNCDTPLQGQFCYSCGQKVIEPKERKVTHFIYQFFGAAFFLENNFFKNLWNLLIHPGKLPLDFIEGRRKRWMPPFSLFLLINLFYFWWSPLTDLNLSLKEQLNQPHHKALTDYLVSKKLSKEHITLEEYNEEYNSKSTNYANSLVILQVPIFAVFLSLFYWRKHYYYSDHFIHALYFCAFVLLGALIQTGLLSLLFKLLQMLNVSFNASSIWQAIGIMYATAIIVYLFFSLRKNYKQKNWQVAVAVLPVLLTFLITHFLYRSILFLIVFIVT